MAGKITAKFGADVSDVEAKMMKATRATKAFAREVKAVDGKGKKSLDFSTQLDRTNSEIGKATGLLKGGALVAGVGMVIGQMAKFSQHAEELGDKATEAQKSAAAWGKEFEAFGNTIKGAGASVLGTLAGWGRSIGDKFRDPLDKAYDEVAESSEESAKRQEEALAKLREAHAKAAAEIPALQAKLKGEQWETQLSSLDEYGRALTEIYHIEKQLAEMDKKPRNAVNDAKRIALEIELEKAKRRERNVSEKIVASEEEKAARDAQARADAEAKAAQTEAERQERAAEEIAKLEEEARIAAMTDEEKLADLRKKGQEAYAKAQESGLNTDKLALAELRKEYADLEESIKAARAAGASANATDPDAKYASIGLKRGDDGKLRRGRVVISQEDADRTLADRERNGMLKSQTGEKGDRSVELLDKIAKALEPKGE